MALADGDKRHGTANGYNNHHCRCDACRQAWAEMVSERRRELDGTLSPDDPRHGTNNAYQNYGCRCSRCKAAHSVARVVEPKP